MSLRNHPSPLLLFIGGRQNERRKEIEQSGAPEHDPERHLH